MLQGFDHSAACSCIAWVLCSNPGGGTSQYKEGFLLLDAFLRSLSLDLDLLLSPLSLLLLLSLSRLSLSLLRDLSRLLDLFSLFTLSSPILIYLRLISLVEVNQAIL